MYCSRNHTLLLTCSGPTRRSGQDSATKGVVGHRAALCSVGPRGSHTGTCMWTWNFTACRTERPGYRCAPACGPCHANVFMKLYACSCTPKWPGQISHRSFALHFCSPFCDLLPRKVRKHFAQARPRMLALTRITIHSDLSGISSGWRSGTVGSLRRLP